MSAAKEALRQQLLLRALWRDDEPGTLRGWTVERAARLQRGLAAYSANAGAAAERALAAQYPTVAALLGEASFAAMARAYWHAWPPQRGDLAWLGEHVSEFLAASASLADDPYLSDVARLDVLLDAAEHAADAAPEPATLTLLGEHEPGRLRIELLPGTALLMSAWPVVAIHAAHQQADGPQRFSGVREALAAGRGECALVWRDGLRARCHAVDAASAGFIRSLLNGEHLEAALETAGDAFAFEPWLLGALQQGWLWRVHVVDA